MDAKAYKRKLIFSLIYFLSALLLLITVSYSWFSLTNVNRASLIAQSSGVEAEYLFYVYRDALNDGLPENPFLVDNICLVEGELDCYLFIANPTVSHLIAGKGAPGDRFSFALKVINIGSQQGDLSLTFNGVKSFNFDLPENRIQTAFYYEVTKIAYENDGVESADIRSLEGLQHNSGYFLQNQTNGYQLIRFVPVYPEDEPNNIVIIFFDMYFDPTIYGVDALGNPYTNSNIFRNQVFLIEEIYMTIFDYE